MKVCRYFIALILVVTLISPTAALSASSAIVMEQGSGRILFAQSADAQRSIASITKLMTALVVLEHENDLQTVVTIGAESSGIEGSSLYLREGEEITVEALLYGLLLRSGNDAAHALAVHIAGSVEDFAELMNEKALALGMVNSHFANPNGLEQEGHHSSAHDMAILGCACLENETLAAICATKSIQFGGRIFQNHNKLLWQYDGCIGMKTGYTETAGRTLVSAATRDEMTLVAVTLNAPDDWSDHKTLLDNAFSAYHTECAVAPNKAVATIPVTGGLLPFVTITTHESVYYPVKSGEALTSAVILDVSSITAPIKAGERAGVLRYFCDGISVGETDLYYQNNVQSLVVPPERFWEKIGGYFGF